MAYDEDLANRLRELLAAEGVETDADVGSWVKQSVAYAKSLPPK